MCIFAGGTGGHVYPALAVANRLRDEGWSVSWVGTRRGLEARVVPRSHLPLHYISARGLRGPARFGAIAAMGLALVQALRLLARIRPALVLGMGGFVSAPGGIAAWLSRRPLLVHEQNAIPGYANRLLARFATGIMQSFPDTFVRRRGWLRTTGNPVRDAIAGICEPAERFSLRSAANPPRLLVLGGSQGAETLNRTVPLAAARLRTPVSIRHQSGEGHQEATRERYRRAGVEARVSPFLEDMAEAYAWADLAVCRAGATTVAELAAAGVGSVLVPYPWAADDHQRVNAQYPERNGASVVVADGEALEDRLVEALEAIAADRSRCLAMAEAARRCGVRDATERVAACCRPYAAPSARAVPAGDGR